MSKHTSKGNQYKYKVNDTWYKTDYLGYESAVEYLVTKILEHSNITNFVKYSLCTVYVEATEYVDCKSKDFLKDGQNLITAYRLLQSNYGIDFMKNFHNKDLESQLNIFVKLIEDCTGIDNFGKYLTTLLELDAFTLNEDRHFNNIALIRNNDGSFIVSPIFDNGAAFLSDIRYSYPLYKNTYGLIPIVKSKPFNSDFDAQVSCAEKLFGRQIWLKDFNIKPFIEEIGKYYSNEICERLITVYNNQKIYYSELFV